MERILVVKLYAIGDFVMSLPALEFLRKERPDAEIHLLTGGRIAPLARQTAPVNRVLELDDRMLGRSPRSLALPFRALALRKSCYSEGYLLHRVLPLRLFMMLTGARLRTGQGNSGAGLTRTVPFETGETEHDSQRYARVFGWDGSSDLPLPGFRVFDPLPPELLPGDSAGRRVAVAPGGGSSTVRRTPGKRWPQERFVSILRLLHEEGCSAVLLGSEEDGKQLDQLRRDLPETTLDLIGKTSITLAASVLSRCDMLLTNDSSLMHIAGLAGTPTLTVFGPTDPGRVGVFPPSPMHRQLTPQGIRCSPCHPPKAVEDCGNPLCMQSIPTLTVWEALKEMLA